MVIVINNVFNIKNQVKIAEIGIKETEIKIKSTC